ncbi:MAG: arylsulfatase [Verrucomicrobia bacterium]|nr:arylsulfatase [Verrucomicrobiota bacterium]
MKRTLAGWIFAAFLIPAAVAVAAGPAAKPNVLIFFADDMGYSDPGCYGGEIATPNLDKLASGGLRFTQFYNTARCWPSRACITTGYYAQAVRRDGMEGIAGGGRGVRPKWARLLPEYLKPLGYRAYHSGKWHIDGPQLAGGFDRSYCLEDHSRNFNPQNHLEDDVKLPPVAPGSGYYTTTAIAEHAIQDLKEHAEKHAGQPFFGYVAFTVPHFPLQAPAEDIARYRDKYRKGWDTVRNERWQRMKAMGIVNCALSSLEREVGPPYYFPDAFAKLGPGEVRFPLPWSELTDAQREFQATKMAIHAAMVDRMDREIGRVLDQVRAMGALDNTVIFFASDNGASAEIMVRGDGHDPAAAPGSAGSYLCLGPGWSSASNAPLRRHKTWVHEGGINTPLIVHWPAGIKARGELRQNPGHLVDLPPTIVELAGGTWPQTLDGKPVPPPHGKSIVSAFAQDGTVTRDCFWWLHEENRAIRAGDWKLVSAAKQGGQWELYDLSKDRCESNNLAVAMPDKVHELEQLWNKQAEQIRALALSDGQGAPTVKKAGKTGKKGKQKPKSQE